MEKSSTDYQTLSLVPVGHLPVPTSWKYNLAQEAYHRALKLYESVGDSKGDIGLGTTCISLVQYDEAVGPLKALSVCIPLLDVDTHAWQRTSHPCPFP